MLGPFFYHFSSPDIEDISHIGHTSGLDVGPRCWADPLQQARGGVAPKPDVCPKIEARYVTGAARYRASGVTFEPDIGRLCNASKLKYRARIGPR